VAGDEEGGGLVAAPEDFGLTAADLAPAPEMMRGTNQEDSSNGRLFVQQHGDFVRFVPERDKWLCWDGKRWRQDHEAHVVELAKQTAASLYQLAAMLPEAERKAFGRHAERSHNVEKLRAMLIAASSDKKVIIHEEGLDADPFLLNCKNGTVHLKSGELRAHDKRNLITKLVETNYDPQSECPGWKSFLSKIFKGNVGLVRFVHLASGYAATGATSEQVWFLLTGSGANGKSTFVNILNESLGDYSAVVGFDTFIASNGGKGIRNDLAALKGVRFASAIESTKGQRFDDAVLKQVTGEDSITCRFLHKEFFTYKPSLKLFLTTNSRPRVTDSSIAFWRRVRLIPFDYRIEEGERIQDFANLLLDLERQGILRWVVQGAKLWAKEKLQAPDEVLAATTEYQEAEDIVYQWRSERTCAGGRCNAGDAYRDFKNYCEGQGFKRAMLRNSFTLELRRLGNPLDAGKRHYEGFELVGL